MKRRTTTSRPTESDRLRLIERWLKQRTKADLVAMILAVAQENVDFLRELEKRLNPEPSVDQLVADVSSAIMRATAFDRRMIGHNFDVDWRAYEDVRTGLAKLVKLGQLAAAKSLAITLMKFGSYQVECSDEGLMSDDICQCLIPVIRAVEAAGGSEAVQWACDMQAADQLQFLCAEELAKLRGKS